MTAWFDKFYIDTYDVIRAKDNELFKLINCALNDMIMDTMVEAKDVSKPRKITIDLDLVRNGDNIGIGWKVTPKPAPYEKIPEKEKVPEGQISLLDVNEETGEIKE